MTVSEQIISVLNALCEKFGIIVDWTAANVLPYAKDLCGRIITYSIASNIAIIVFLIITTVILSFTLKYFITKYKKADYYENDGWMVASIMNGIILGSLCITGCVIIPELVMKIIQAFTIPELTIIQMIEDLM